jgi:F-type H+/Na+-transporting ATPase subunit alpha
LDISQYLELQIFARFGTELDAETQRQLARGRHVREVLRQPQHRPQPVSHQVAVLHAAGQGYLDDLPIDQVREFERYLIDYLEAHYASLLDQLARGRWTRQVRTELPEAIEACRKAYATRQSEE